MSVDDRRARSDRADGLCQEAFEQAKCPERGVSLVAVGGYGRRELAPYSDLDVVLLHDSGVAAGEWANQLWYPLWDSGHAIDHSVRTPEQVLSAAEADLRVAMGMLDLRHLAGDPNITLRVRSAVLTQWRRDARLRLPELRDLVERRRDRYGELAHAAVPDLKESSGGLRDATILSALVASWLVDVPHAELDRCRRELQDVRDALHQAAGRATDKVIPEFWEPIAAQLGLDGPEQAQAFTRTSGRRLAHLSRLIWQRAEAVQRRSPGRRGPRLQSLGGGIAIAAEEVVLAPDARPERDPAVLFRAARVAAERGLVLAPTTAARLARVTPTIPEPWTGPMRDDFVRMLAGPGLLPVWETLDETGALARILPEWDRVRLLPHASVVHRFTVDRHLVETCHEAAALIRWVSRPDVLLVAALLHDIGKGGQGEHSVVGEPIAGEIATRMGFATAEVGMIKDLVRWHLLLPTVATTRDLDDPETPAMVTERISNREVLQMLRVLTEADARATSAKAWSPWRSALINELASRTATILGGADLHEGDGPGADGDPGLLGSIAEWDRSEQMVIQVEHHDDGAQVVVQGQDRAGLLADVSAMFARLRIQVRAARVWTEQDRAISVWEVDQLEVDPAVLRQSLNSIVEGRLGAEPTRVQQHQTAVLDASVLAHPEASTTASVVEVRTSDRLGLVNTVCTTIAAAGTSIRSAHLSTFGPQAVDVFYLVDATGSRLESEHLDLVLGLLREALVLPGSG